MDLKSVRFSNGATTRRGRDASIERCLPQTTSQKRELKRGAFVPLAAQGKGTPGGGTVKFKSPVPPPPAKSPVPGIGTFGVGKKKQGTVKLTGTVSLRGRPRPRDQKTVFVAGATGALGSRIVRLGFKVRAGCANIDQAAEELDVLVRYGIVAANQSRSVSFVQIDWNDEDVVLSAIGSAGKVVFTGEGGPPGACVALIGTCEELGVGQFVLVTSPAGARSGGTSFLGGFSGSPSSMKQAQTVLETSNLSFTVIQPGDLERMSDDDGSTMNVAVGKSGQISKLQVAELVTSCFVSAGLAENKVLAVSADSSADNASYEDILSKVDPLISKEDQLAREAERQEARGSIAALADKVTALEEQTVDAKERSVALNDKIKELQALQRTKQKDATPMLRSSAQVEKQLDKLFQEVETQDKEEAVARALYAEAQKASREARLLTKNDEKDIAFAVLNPEIVKQREEEAAAKAALEEEKRLAAEAKQKEAEAAKAEAAAAKAKAEEEAKKKAEAEAEAKKTEQEAKIKAAAEAEAKKKAAAEAKKKEEEAKRAALEEQKKAAAEAKKKEEEAAKAKAEAEARQKEEEAARAKAELEAKKAQEEAEAKKREEEAARAKAEAEAAQRAEEEAATKMAAEEAARVKAEEEATKKAEEEATKKAEEEAEAKKKKEEAAKAAAKAREEALAESARQKAEAKKKAEEAAAKARAARQAKQGTTESPFANIFGSWKAPWDQTSVAPEADDRPTAREWIEAWRAKQRGEVSAEEWIQNWRDKQGASKDEEASARARDWLQHWRSSLK